MIATPNIDELSKALLFKQLYCSKVTELVAWIASPGLGAPAAIQRDVSYGQDPYYLTKIIMELLNRSFTYRVELIIVSAIVKRRLPRDFSWRRVGTTQSRKPPHIHQVKNLGSRKENKGASYRPVS